MARRSSKVGHITRRISKGLQGLRRDLLALSRAVQSALSADGASRTRAGDGRRARRRLTPADRARLKVQGEYLGLVRHLSVRDRARVKALRSRKGYGQAIQMARKLVRGRA